MSDFRFDLVALAVELVGLSGLALLFVDRIRAEGSLRLQQLGLFLAVQPFIVWLVERAAVIRELRAAVFVPETLTEGEALVPRRGLDYHDWPMGGVLDEHHLTLDFGVLAPAILAAALALLVAGSVTRSRGAEGERRLSCVWPQLALTAPILLGALVMTYASVLIQLAPRYRCCMFICPPTGCMAIGEASGALMAGAELIVGAPVVIVGLWLLARVRHQRDESGSRERVSLRERWPALLVLVLGLGAYGYSQRYVGAEFEASACKYSEPTTLDPRLDHPIVTTRARVHASDRELAEVGAIGHEHEVIELMLDRHGTPWHLHFTGVSYQWSKLFVDDDGEYDAVDEATDDETRTVVFTADDGAPPLALTRLFAAFFDAQIERVIVWAPCPRERHFPGFGLVHDEVACELGVIELDHEGERLGRRSWPELSAALAQAPGRTLKVHPPCLQHR